MERAQNLPGAPGMMPGMPGMPGMMPGIMPGTMPGANQVVQVIEPVIPKIKVISGTRVFDAVTGELLDDAVEKSVPETQKDDYYDDGTHGDLEAGDGKYSKVDERREAISPSNQRIKEQLVQALVVAEQLDPLAFYGFSLMSTERHETAPRDRAWQLVPDPDGGPGLVMRENPVDKPLTVPKYRTWRSEKDAKVKDDWSYRFLQEYRKNKDNLTSEFYPMHVPMPPPMPSVAPPPAQIWTPFSDPGALDREKNKKRSRRNGRWGRYDARHARRRRCDG